jgi:hypothetical protein
MEGIQPRRGKNSGFRSWQTGGGRNARMSHLSAGETTWCINMAMWNFRTPKHGLVTISTGTYSRWECWKTSNCQLIGSASCTMGERTSTKLSCHEQWICAHNNAWSRRLPLSDPRTTLSDPRLFWTPLPVRIAKLQAMQSL